MATNLTPLHSPHPPVDRVRVLALPVARHSSGDGGGGEEGGVVEEEWAVRGGQFGAVGVAEWGVVGPRGGRGLHAGRAAGGAEVVQADAAAESETEGRS